MLGGFKNHWNVGFVLFSLFSRAWKFTLQDSRTNTVSCPWWFLSCLHILVLCSKLENGRWGEGSGRERGWSPDHALLLELDKEQGGSC